MIGRLFRMSQKKKICLQNTSDGIKHSFLTDSPKTCEYLMRLCSDQHKFYQHMKTRQNTQEQQDIGTDTYGQIFYVSEGLERCVGVSCYLVTSS